VSFTNVRKKYLELPLPLLFQGLGTFKLTHSCVQNQQSTPVWSVLVSVQLSVSLAALRGFTERRDQKEKQDESLS